MVIFTRLCLSETSWDELWWGCWGISREGGSNHLGMGLLPGCKKISMSEKCQNNEQLVLGLFTYCPAQVASWLEGGTGSNEMFNQMDKGQCSWHGQF